MPNVPGYYSVPFPAYQPAMRNILSITQSFPCIVTTTFDGTQPGDNQYLNGLIVRLVIPDGFGMVQANQLIGPITVINDSQFSMPIDTTLFDQFVQPANNPPFWQNPGHYFTPAQVVPVGQVNDQLIAATQNVLPYP